MSNTISIRHNFEAGHRLPHLEGKCQSLHGHSFWAEVWIEAQGSLHEGIAVEYGEAKAFLRGWIDTHWDHGLILGRDDPLYDTLSANGKVYSIPDGWPTVETLAHHLAGVVNDWCRDHNRSTTRGGLPPIRCTRVRVQETHVNAAEWSAFPHLWAQQRS
jgi:6-pyruvoyltetrahydropterin/6-carboxytetrahydropterin synthase